MQVAVIGAGAVGCYYGGLLLRAGHDVTFIGRRTHVDAINAHGLLLDTQVLQGAPAREGGYGTAALASPDLVLFCVKSADTEEAGRSLAGRLRPETSILSLQNGVDNPQRLRGVTGHPVIPAVVYVGSEMAGPGHVRHHGGGDLVIGASPASQTLAETLTQPASRQRSQTTSKGSSGASSSQLRLQRAFGRGGHLLRTDAGGRGHEGCRRERGAGSVMVARASGVSMPEDLLERILKIPAAMPNQMSSTAQDLARGKPTEIDFLNGYVVRKGAELGIPTPTNHALQVMVKLAERRSETSGRRG